MFGTSFGTRAPEQSREKEALNAEIVDTLMESGLITDPSSLSSEEYEALNVRATLLEKNMNRDTAYMLAYLDRKINQDKSAGNTGEAFFSKVTPSMISSLISPSLSSNQEYVQTVLNLVAHEFKRGNHATYSDALIAAVGIRGQEIAATPDLTVTLDGQDNVVQPGDKELLK